MKKEIIFGENFKKYRKLRGISQKEFAQRLFEVTGKKLTLTSISNYETGVHMPPPQILPVIAEILEVSIDALFGKEETALEASPEELAQDAVKEWKQEMEKLEKTYIYWKAANEASLGKEEALLVDFCERLLALGKNQQDELVVLQTELSTIRELLSMFKGKL